MHQRPTTFGERDHPAELQRQALALRLTPLVRRAVARALARFRRAARGRAVAQEVDDLAQEALLVLFANDARALSQWSSERGASFESYAGLIAERAVLTVLRSRRRSPFTEDPIDVDELAQWVSPAPSPEATVVARDLLAHTQQRLARVLPPRGYRMFEQVFLEEEELEHVAAEAGIDRAAVYAWRYRFAKLVSTPFGASSCVAVKLNRSAPGSSRGLGRTKRAR